MKIDKETHDILNRIEQRITHPETIDNSFGEALLEIAQRFDIVQDMTQDFKNKLIEDDLMNEFEKEVKSWYKNYQKYDKDYTINERAEDWFNKFYPNDQEELKKRFHIKYQENQKEDFWNIGYEVVREMKQEWEVLKTIIDMTRSDEKYFDKAREIDEEYKDLTRDYPVNEYTRKSGVKVKTHTRGEGKQKEEEDKMILSEVEYATAMLGRPIPHPSYSEYLEKYKRPTTYHQTPKIDKQTKEILNWIEKNKLEYEITHGLGGEYGDLRIEISKGNKAIEIRVFPIGDGVDLSIWKEKGYHSSIKSYRDIMLSHAYIYIKEHFKGLVKDQRERRERNINGRK